MSSFLKQKPLILASNSKIRKKLLESLNLKFDVVPADCDEEKIKQECQKKAVPLITMASLIAREKALLVSKSNPQSYVIAADQICAQDELYFDKPGNHETAIEHLKCLNGKTHQQIAALCIAHAGKVIWEKQELATLTMLPLSLQTIEGYLRQEIPYQSCGAYQYEGLGKWLFKEVIGSDSTILGLPLIPLKEALLSLDIVKI